jgi:stringent starvation protein B
VITIARLPGFLIRGSHEKAKINLASTTTLTVKGKQPWRPVAVEIVPSGQATLDVLFGFARVPLDMENEDVDFSSRIGGASVEQRFHLREMLLRGRLEL